MEIPALQGNFAIISWKNPEICRKSSPGETKAPLCRGELSPKGTEGVYAAEFLYIPRRGTVWARHASPANFQHLNGKNRRKRRPEQRKAFPWRKVAARKGRRMRGRDAASLLSVGAAACPARPNFIRRTGVAQSLPLQEKPFLRSTGPVPPAGACPSRGGAKQGVQRILHRNLKFDAES